VLSADLHEPKHHRELSFTNTNRVLERQTTEQQQVASTVQPIRENVAPEDRVLLPGRDRRSPRT
jgi:hypothetical protein